MLLISCSPGEGKEEEKLLSMIISWLTLSVTRIKIKRYLHYSTYMKSQGSLKSIVGKALEDLQPGVITVSSVIFVAS